MRELLKFVQQTGRLVSALVRPLLWLAVFGRQLENFAGTMNFVIFPMYFLSTALYPLRRARHGMG